MPYSMGVLNRETPRSGEATFPKETPERWISHASPMDFHPRGRLKTGGKQVLYINRRSPVRAGEKGGFRRPFHGPRSS